ncbi:YolD-like family protein [Paenibacillus gansuensis]|uniref:YolD-like family protein n=1 Tax=Paenibacillus gansuensis TaxID=306542 RepID=A0ABW5P8M1_9BACL
MRWETKYILPEHREAILKQKEERSRRTRKELDEQRWGEINELITDCYEFRVPIKLHLFDYHEDLIIQGVIEKVDPIGSRLMINGDWFKVENIQEAE